jgi:hypothetical protein
MRFKEQEPAGHDPSGLTTVTTTEQGALSHRAIALATPADEPSPSRHTDETKRDFVSYTRPSHLAVLDASTFCGGAS